MACITIIHQTSNSLPLTSAHIGYPSTTNLTLNYTFTGTAVKIWATMILLAIGVWMITS